MANWSDWSDHLRLGVFPEVVYAPIENVDVSLGAFIVGGRGTTLFGRWGDADQV